MSVVARFAPFPLLSGHQRSITHTQILIPTITTITTTSIIVVGVFLRDCMVANVSAFDHHVLVVSPPSVHLVTPLHTLTHFTIHLYDI